MSVKTTIRFLFLAVILTAVFFTTCESPMGMGDSIDWEPPVLKIDPVPNPLYVRNGTKLSGTVTDNVKVARVVMTNSLTGEPMFNGVITGDIWEIELVFDESQNGEKITARVDAYDISGRNDSRSTAFVTLIIDIRPPIIKKPSIQRTDTRISELMSIRQLQNLVDTDPNGEKKDDLYKYQNGWFTFSGVASDEETQVEIISLKIYDSSDINTALLEIPLNKDATPYFPKWTIKEEEIIAAGAAKKGQQYEDDYYNNNARYYYRMVVSAIDKSKNTATNIEEDEGYICMWAKSDEPKGVYDPSLGTSIPKGTPLPVDFYDDDMLAWGFTGLLTKEQWDGFKYDSLGNKIDAYIGPSSLKITEGLSDDEKLAFLKEKLTGTSGEDVTLSSTATIYDWNYDKHGTITGEIKNQITTSVDEKLVYVQTGNTDADYGEFVLFTIAADKKTYLDGGSGPRWTNTNIWRGKIWRISVVDENAPLIVFDTTKKDSFGNPKAHSPEENTFPDLTGGEFFNIMGYTLRDRGSGPNPNKVEKFRLAIIPFNYAGWADSQIGSIEQVGSVKNILKSGNFPDPASTMIKYKNITFTTQADYTADGSTYYKQDFSEQFSVLKDFMLNDRIENNTKLFVFYAQDNMGHDVFRELRLLGSKTTPDMTIYDVTNIISNNSMPSLPNPNGYADTINGGLQAGYYDALNAANITAYSTIKSGSSGNLSGKESEPFNTYPRNTVIKYWVKVKKTGFVDIEDIRMEDITYEGTPKTIGYVQKDADGKLNDVIHDSLNNVDYVPLSFCEQYPDVTQRTFRFIATDRLGNEAKIQRTIAITNAAQLVSITTESQNGTYGAFDGDDNKAITLKANFSGLVYLTTGSDVKLNITYTKNGSTINESLSLKSMPPDAGALSLDFDFKVPVGATGQLKTMDASLGTGDAARPLTLTGKIMDKNRGTEAFLPGYTTESISMPNWTGTGLDLTKSLQGTKTIMLDGIQPVIKSTSFTAPTGKTPYTGANAPGGGTQYYFKSGETIELTLTTGLTVADKEIRNKGTPKLSYQIKQSNGVLSTSNTTAFAYTRSNGTKSLVFALPVSSANADGELVNVTLVTTDANNKIIDSYNNTAVVATGALETNLIPSGTRIFIKKTIPEAPKVSTNVSGFTNFGDDSAKKIYLRTKPTITIAASTSKWNVDNIPWEDTIQYSKDNGVTWSNGSLFDLENGFNTTACVRYVDRAGNNGAELKQLVQVNTDFPTLVAVSARQSNGWYLKGSRLDFILSFASEVKVTNASQVSITLKDITDSSTKTLMVADARVENSSAILSQTSDRVTIVFTWYDISDSEMQNGLSVQSIDIRGLEDSYGNHGGQGTGSPSATTTSNIIEITPETGSKYTCFNLPYKGIKVDAIVPTVTTWVPGNSAKGTVTVSGNDAVKKIVLTFREPVMKGSGVITIRPRVNYAIPPVIRDTGYYIGENDKEYSSLDAAKLEGKDATYISSFYDIYNNSDLNGTDRSNLTQGSSMSNLDLNDRTGQSKGPYKKTTQGLIEGPGYSGDYNSGDGSNAPNLKKLVSGKYEDVRTAMIPDTATKWVLDYRYLIDDTTANSAVSKIRDVLTKAKWRWQEIDVIKVEGDGSATITIPLNEPLLKGLVWDVYYPAGTFTDKAGNIAEALGVTDTDPTKWTNNDYYFTTPGVQPPVIRVDRRSYDGRNSNWKTSADNGTTSYTQPGTTNDGIPFTTANWTTNTIVYTDTGLGTDSGWGVNDFNSIHYRVETESPGVSIEVKYYKGSYSNKGGVKAGWNNNGVASTNGTTALGTDVNWSADAENIPGTWILPNLIRRSRTSGTVSYNVITKSGNTETRRFAGAYRGFRSYNKDLTKADLNFDTGILTSTATLSTNNDGSKNQGVMTGFDSLESSKSYVVAQATKNGQKASGCEGIFRTVVAYNYGTTPPVSDNLYIEGSNIKNGMPSVAGFPVRDAEETGDRRFIKRFHMMPAGGGDVTTRTQFYWVSTEIVCEWYLLCWGGGANRTHQDVGEVNNYLTVGYGDLTYGRSITRSGRD